MDGWRVGLRSQDVEIIDPVPLEIDGTLPTELRGALHLLGPGRHHVSGDPDRNWLDGDGLAHMVAFDERGATYRRRYVTTRKKAAEDLAGRRLFATLGSPPPGGLLRRFWFMAPRSPANRGVVVHAGRVLALWDGSRPYALDPATLETVGEEDFGGVLRNTWDSFTSSPKLDVATGELWGFGATRRRSGRVVVWRIDGRGVGHCAARARLGRRVGVGVFALTPTRAVVLLPPLGLPRMPWPLVTGKAAVAECWEWCPERGVQVLVVDRTTGAVRRTTAEARFVTAVAQAFDDGDNVVVDAVSYRDPRILDAAFELMRGELRTTAYGTLERFRIRPDGTVEQAKLPPLEAPAVAPGAEGPSARVFGVTLNPKAGFIGLAVAVDVGTGKVTWAAPHPDEVAGPPAVVPRADGMPWVLYPVLDTARSRTTVRVYDGTALGDGPVAEVILPDPVPLGFRTAWSPHRREVPVAPSGAAC